MAAVENWTTVKNELCSPFKIQPLTTSLLNKSLTDEVCNLNFAVNLNFPFSLFFSKEWQTAETEQERRTT